MSKYRPLGFVATLFGVTGWVVAGSLFVSPGPRAEAEEPKAHAKPDKEWNDKDKFPTTCPEVKAALIGAAKLPEVVVFEADPPAVKAAKRQILARQKTAAILIERINIGAISDSNAFGQLADAIADVPEAAAAIWDKPDQLLPWYEWRVAVLKEVEKYVEQREKAGAEVLRHNYPTMVAERYKAEVALLKLREQMAPGAPPKPSRPIRER
jgi:hypothetical protein